MKKLLYSLLFLLILTHPCFANLADGTNVGFLSASPSSDPAGDLLTGVDAQVRAGKYTSPAGATGVNEIGFWVDNATEEANFEVGIYSHDAANNRPNLLLSGASQTNAKGTGAGWKKSSVTISISESTVYWLAWQLDDTATATDANTNYTTGLGTRHSKNSQTALPATWGTSDGTNNTLIGIYAVYTTASGTAPQPYFPAFDGGFDNGLNGGFN